MVDDAIDLARALVAAGMETPATTEVCALYPGAALADAEDRVRAMLSEQGFPEPPLHPTDEERFTYLVRAFGLGTVPSKHFYREYHRLVPNWDEQSPAGRRMLRLLDDWETEDDDKRKDMLVAKMGTAIVSARRLELSVRRDPLARKSGDVKTIP